MIVSGLIVLALAGLWLCFSILQYAQGKNSTLSDFVCGHQNKCRHLLAAGRIYGVIHLEDIGIWYFAGQFLFLLFAAITGKSIPALCLIAVPAAIGPLGSVVSIIYQGLIARSWCRLCLLVILILWLQVITIIFYFHGNYQNWSLLSTDTTTCLLFTACLLLGAAWLSIKPIYVKAGLAQKYQDRLTTWKRNPVFFHTLLRQQKHLTIEPMETDIVLGNIASDLQLLAILNPYCRHCKRSFSQLNDLAYRFPDKLHIRIRFKLHLTGITKERSLKAVLHILYVYLHTDDTSLKATLLPYWFAVMRLRKWREHFGSIPETTDELATQIEATEKWMETNRIHYTPTIFINGYELPDSYTLQDIASLVPVLYQPSRVITINKLVKE